MKHIKGYKTYNESSTTKRGNSNLISTLCTGMLLINPNFLDNILDNGLKSRYTEDTSVFLNDLRNLLFANNRLRLGIYKDNRCVLDEELSKINQEFNDYSQEFDIEKDWNKLLTARKTARNIQKRLLGVDDLTTNMISYIYWLGPNKDRDNNMDIIVELKNGKQYPIYINKKINSSKSQSFNTFGDILIGDDINKLYTDEYMSKWNKLTQEWVRIIYENSNKNIQLHIEKFIDPSRIPSISYFDYFDIKHSNREYQHIGEYMSEFNKNILKFSDLMSEIYKLSEETLKDHTNVLKEWNELKRFILHSKIIEHLYTESFKKLQDGEPKIEGKYIIADDNMKMRLLKLFVELLNISENDTYYFSSSGEEFKKLPKRQYFRDMYDRITVKYDYHTELTDINSEDEVNGNDNVSNKKDSDFIIRYDLDGEPLAKLNLDTTWSGGEMSGNLSIKMSLDLNKNFNELVDNINEKFMLRFLKENWKEMEASPFSFLTKESLETLDTYRIEQVYKVISNDMKNINNIL